MSWGCGRDDFISPRARSFLSQDTPHPFQYRELLQLWNPQESSLINITWPQICGIQAVKVICSGVFFHKEPQKVGDWEGPAPLRAGTDLKWARAPGLPAGASASEVEQEPVSPPGRATKTLTFFSSSYHCCLWKMEEKEINRLQAFFWF